mgnify:CR=1 FL=1
MDRMGVETARSQALTLEDYLIPSYGERHGLWWPPEGGRRMDGVRARVCPSGRTAVLKGLKYVTRQVSSTVSVDRSAAGEWCACAVQVHREELHRRGVAAVASPGQG